MAAGERRLAERDQDLEELRGQLEQARTYLQAALVLRPQFEQYYPNYGPLLERELAEVEEELRV